MSQLALHFITRFSTPFKSLIDLGVLKSEIEYIRQKISLSNQLGLLLLALAVLSTVIFSRQPVDNRLIIIVGSISVVPVITILLNMAGFVNASRLALSTLSPLIVLITIVGIKVFGADNYTISEHHFFTPRYYLMSLCLLPVFLIDVREKNLFSLAFTVNIFCLLFFDPLHRLCGVGPSDFGFEFHHYYQATISPIILLFFLYGSIIFYQLENHKYQTHIKRLNKALNEKSERMSTEIALAKNVIEGFLPKRLPTIPGVEMGASLKWSKEVGGDYYTVTEVDPGRFLMMIADVSGKGLAASIIVSSIHSCIETLNRRKDNFDIRQFVTQLNEVLFRLNENCSYVTAWIALYDSENRTIESVRAGHPKPLFIRPDTFLPDCFEKGGTFLGLLDAEYTFETQTLQLLPGDLIIAFTDGLTEAANIKNEMFGEENIEKIAHRYVDQKPAFIIKRLEDEINFFTASDYLEDDMTIFVMKVK